MISIINSIHISLQEFCAEYLSITIAGRTDGLWESIHKAVPFVHSWKILSLRFLGQVIIGKT
jgi:hypothetical protein